MRQRLLSILLLTLACAAAAWTAFARPPGSTNGSYNCIVAADFTGEGNVSINGSAITFRFWVRDQAGNAGALTASVVVTNNRFSGEGTVLGRPMTIQGRIDPADQQNGEQLRGQRLVATFRDNNKHHGRITGSPRLRGNGNQGGNQGGGQGGGQGGQGGGQGGDDDDQGHPGNQRR